MTHEMQSRQLCLQIWSDALLMPRRASEIRNFLDRTRGVGQTDLLSYDDDKLSPIFVRQRVVTRKNPREFAGYPVDLHLKKVN